MAETGMIWRIHMAVSWEIVVVGKPPPRGEFGAQHNQCLCAPPVYEVDFEIARPYSYASARHCVVY